MNRTDSLTVKFRADASNLQRGMKAADRSIKSAGAALGKSFAAAFIAVFSVEGIRKATQMLAEAGRRYSEFERGTRKALPFLGDFKNVEEALKNLDTYQDRIATTTRDIAGDLDDVSSAYTQMVYDGVTNMDQLADAAGRLSVAISGSFADLTGNIQIYSKTYGKELDKLAQMTGQTAEEIAAKRLFALAGRTTATPAEMSKALGKVIPAGARFEGRKIQATDADVLAMYGHIMRITGQSEQSATSVEQIIRELTDPLNKNLNAFISATGVNTLPDLLKELQKYSAETVKQIIRADEAFGGFVTLTRNFDEFLETSRRIAEAGRPGYRGMSAAESWQRATPSYELDKIRAEWQTLVVDVGREVMQNIKPILKGLNEVLGNGDNRENAIIAIRVLMERLVEIAEDISILLSPVGRIMGSFATIRASRQEKPLERYIAEQTLLERIKEGRMTPAEAAAFARTFEEQGREKMPLADRAANFLYGTMFFEEWAKINNPLLKYFVHDSVKQMADAFSAKKVFGEKYSDWNWTEDQGFIKTLDYTKVNRRYSDVHMNGEGWQETKGELITELKKISGNTSRIPGDENTNVRKSK